MPRHFSKLQSTVKHHHYLDTPGMQYELKIEKFFSRIVKFFFRKKK